MSLYIAVAANAFWGDVFTKKSTIPMTQSVAVLTGCAAGATESFLVTPFELVKIRLQDKASTFTGPVDVLKQTLARSGPLGLYVGMEATFWRHVSWNGGYFGSIFQIRSLLPKAESKSGELFNNFLSGSVGGAIGTALNTPCEFEGNAPEDTLGQWLTTRWPPRSRRGKVAYPATRDRRVVSLSRSLIRVASRRRETQADLDPSSSAIFIQDFPRHLPSGQGRGSRRAVQGVHSQGIALGTRWRSVALG